MESTTHISLDTKLTDIGWDNADAIGEDLIDTRITGDDWGWAWASVERQNGTVRDLRDDLYSTHKS